MDEQKRMILSDNLWSVMWKLSWPAIVAMVLYGLNMIVDAIFVGKFVGEDALAGVSIAYQLSALTLGLGSLIGVGAGSLLGISLGANDVHVQKRLIGNVNYITIVVSVVYTIVGLVFAVPLVKLMGGTGAALEMGVAYYKITVIGSVFWIYGLAANMLVRAEGKMKSAAVMMGAGLLINILFNYIFIVLLEYGVSGAAWATNIGMLVYTLMGILYFKKGKATFPVSNPFAVHRDKQIVKSIVSMGMPSLIMNIMIAIQAVVVFDVLSKHGTLYDIAFYGAVFRIFNFLMTPIFGLMRALQPVLSINYGAQQYDRVIKGFWIFVAAGMLFILPFWAMFMISPQTILGTMFDVSTITNASLLNAQIFLSILPLLSFVFMAMTLFPAIDHSKPATVLGIVRQVIFYMPIMIIMPRMFGLDWVYVGSALIDLATLAIALVYVLKAFKKLKAAEYSNRQANAST
ncbi:MATE family efflux transporter [Paenibacillus arenosi]|uniref:Multidrug export protein MepA n=1 Tax=Paenibacillus arenosi TaxID=2774142 RepID=A0ABR9AYY6_9BACL|nr:MATE family efflux transporter [Paenibacillus arenosi]MBD8499351.1 MATE family efflux transporter [Paenibacillus arenosi]